MTKETAKDRREELERIGFGYVALCTGHMFSEPVSVQEALAAADLDWQVELWDTFAAPPADAPTRAAVGDGKPSPVPFSRVIERVNADGTHWSLATVGTRYQLLQNQQAFDFAVELVGEYGAEVVAAGTVGQPVGRNTFMALRVPRSIVFGDDDVVHCYVLLRASHGEAAMVARVIPVHSRTGAELTTNIPGAPQEFTIRHSGDIGRKLAEAEHVMRMVEDWAVEFEGMTSQMLATRVDEGFMRAFAAHVLPTPRGAGDRSQEQWAERRADMVRVWETTEGGFGAGTAYAAFLAANVYIDDHAAVRAGQDARQVRAERSLNGEALKLKHRAWAWLSQHM